MSCLVVLLTRYFQWEDGPGLGKGEGSGEGSGGGGERHQERCHLRCLYSHEKYPRVDVAMGSAVKLSVDHRKKKSK